ncbi:MAG: transcriptional repressor [Gemmatales bacterium]|nr:transcriptional repressor [Gemmatales bacterium]MDW7995229.1 transcriptional repressor [Gemmatales bacterium]
MKMRPENTELREALSEAGLRYTAQREAVYDYLCSVYTHPTAEEVYHAVRQRIPRISLATVYKCLEALVACGKATKITSSSGPTRYDPRTDRHIHMHDVRTGEVRDLHVPPEFPIHEQLQAQLENLVRQSGFRITDVRIELMGYFDGPGHGSSSAS